VIGYCVLIVTFIGPMKLLLLSTTWSRFSRSYCCTQCDRLLAWYCRLYVTLCIVALRVGVGSWQLHRRVPRIALPIHFFRHFCCRIYRSATTHSEKPNRRNFRIWKSHGQRGHVIMVFMDIPDAEISQVWFCSYTIRRTQYDRPS